MADMKKVYDDLIIINLNVLDSKESINARYMPTSSKALIFQN